MNVHEALKAVAEEAPSPFARTYAEAALQLGGSTQATVETDGLMVSVHHVPTGQPMVGEEMKVQILYVLSNLGTWRGPRAREVKEVLKQAIK